MWKYSIKYAMLCGFFLVVLFWVSIKLGSNPFIAISHLLFDVLIFSLCIYFAEREYKVYEKGGYLHFWEGMTISFLIYLPAAVIFTLSLILILQQNEWILQDYKTEMIAMLEKQKDVFLERISIEEFEQRKSDVQGVSSSDLILGSMIKKAGVGFFVAPVVSIILKKNN